MDEGSHVLLRPRECREVRAPGSPITRRYSFQFTSMSKIRVAIFSRNWHLNESYSAFFSQDVSVLIIRNPHIADSPIGIIVRVCDWRNN